MAFQSVMLTRAMYTREINYSIRVRAYANGKMAFRVSLAAAREMKLIHGMMVDLLHDHDSGKFMLRAVKEGARGVKVCAIPWSHQKKPKRSKNPPTTVSACIFTCFLDPTAKVSAISDQMDPAGKATVFLANDVTYGEKEATFILRKHGNLDV